MTSNNATKGEKAWRPGQSGCGGLWAGEYRGHRVGGIAGALRAVLASVLMMLVLTVGSARAGTYVIGDCPAAFNQSGSAGPWTFVGVNQSNVTEATKLECSGGPGDWIGFGTDDIPGFTGFRMTTAGTNLTVLSAKMWWRAYGSFSDNGREDFPHSYGQIVDGQGNGDSQFTTGTVWDTTSNPLVVNFPAADSATTVEIGENCIPFNNLLSCPMGNSGPQYGGVALAVQIFGVELTLQDNLPPSAEVVGGSLDGPGPVTGPAQLAFIEPTKTRGSSTPNCSSTANRSPPTTTAPPAPTRNCRRARAACQTSSHGTPDRSRPASTRSRCASPTRPVTRHSAPRTRSPCWPRSARTALRARARRSP